MKKYLIGAAVALVSSWAWRKYNVGEFVAPFVDKAKNTLKEKANGLRNKCTAETENN